MKMLKIVLKGVLLTCICILGIFANILSLIVIMRYNVISTFDKLLCSLAIIDTLLLFVFFFDSGLLNLQYPLPPWYNYLVPFIHAIKHMTITCSIYMVVIISIERHRAILSPFKKSLKWSNCLSFVIAVSIFINLPKFLEFKTETISKNDPKIIVTPLAENKIKSCIDMGFVYIKYSRFI